MVTDTSSKILEYIRTNSQAKAVDLVRVMGITNSAVHRQLNKLLSQGHIMKVGKPPVVFYILKKNEKRITTVIPQDVRDFIDSNYIYVSPAGEFMAGMDGFMRWVLSISQERYILPLTHEYVKVRTEADTFIESTGWIDATLAKEVSTFGDTVLKKMMYSDFYSIEKFGKTKLGQMVLYAKTSQNIQIIEDIVTHIKPVITSIIEKYEIDTIAYIPPSIKRSVQLMSELKKRLEIQLPELCRYHSFLEFRKRLL